MIILESLRSMKLEMNTFFSTTIPVCCSTILSIGDLQLLYNILSLIGHLYPGMEYIKTEKKTIIINRIDYPGN